ncbi:hypothetical protein ACH42_16265 [Endozoicomonas sp. (ex Bugula neritina AB1)]|nr:hypothetical protein ACH42_16265 [Endozoicomonas sp. (ex Bugula neritina AB1)]
MQSPSTHSTVSHWLAWLENTRSEQDIELGLDRISQVGRSLDLLKPAPYVITVAGTNGKGSTIAILEAILIEAGYSVGAFTSPHFLSFNERIRVDGKMVDDQDLCEAFTVINEGRKSTWLTYFEFATLAAVHCFKKANVDVALMEVGLGGRLDATNAIDPDIAVMTTVGLDHQDWLGYSIEAIAGEKAGIIRAEKPIVFGDFSVPKAVINRSIRLDAPLYRNNKEFFIEKHEKEWSWQGRDEKGQSCQFEHLPYPQLVIENAATALQALQLSPFKINQDVVRKSLESVTLTGRYQTRWVKNKAGDNIEVILDVSHNPQAATRLKENLQNYSAGKTRMIFAMYKDKDYAAVANVLADSADEWLITTFNSPRALTTDELVEVFKVRHSQVCGITDVEQALSTSLAHSDKGDRIIVSGSFITVADALTFIEQC